MGILITKHRELTKKYTLVFDLFLSENADLSYKYDILSKTH
jgi:hypothetical protein